MKKSGNPNPKIENLKPAKKGEIRNPTGRPKGALSLTTLLKNALEEDFFVYEKDAEGKIILDEKGKPKILKKMLKKNALIYALASKAINDKDMQAIREIFDRLEGKVALPTQQLGRDGQPIDTISTNIQIEIIKNYNENQNQSDTETNAGVGSTD